MVETMQEERSDKDKILSAISSNIDDLLKQNIDNGRLKQNLAFKIVSRQLNLQNIVDCAVIGITIYLQEHKSSKDNKVTKG